MMNPDDDENVMWPKLVRVGNSCYRRRDQKQDGIIQTIRLPVSGCQSENSRQSQVSTGTTQTQPVTGGSNRPMYLISLLENDDNVDDQEEKSFPEQDEFVISNQDDGGGTNMVITMHVAPPFIGYIIGKGGVSKKQIEQETETRLRFVKCPNDAGSLVITGHHRNCYRACANVLAKVRTARQRQMPTHFLSLPLSLDCEGIVLQFVKFRSQIMADPKCSPSIDESVFQTETRLHLTIAVLYLGDTFEQNLAVKHLRSFRDELIGFLTETGADPVILQVKGLDIMNDDPSSADVLYARVKELGHRNRFQHVVNRLWERYVRLGLSCEPQRTYHDSEWKVKIHVTVMNKKFRERNDPVTGGSMQRSSAPARMDVRHIIHQYGDYDFGHWPLRQIHLSAMHSQGPDGYYKYLDKIDF